MKSDQSTNIYFIGIALLSLSFGEASALASQSAVSMTISADGSYPSHTGTARPAESTQKAGFGAKGGLPIFNKADKDGASGSDIAYNFMKNGKVDQSKRNAEFYAPKSNSPNSHPAPNTISEPSIEGQIAPSEHQSEPETHQRSPTPSNIPINDTNSSGSVVGSTEQDNLLNIPSVVSDVPSNGNGSGENLSTMDDQSRDFIENVQATYASGIQDQISPVQTGDIGGTSPQENDGLYLNSASNSNISGMLLSLILLF